jgi:hypothetical protein
MLVDRLSRLEAQDLLRHCVEQGRVIPGFHFRKALEDEGLDMMDAEYVMKNGKIYNEGEHHAKTREWNYRVECCIPEGTPVGIVFSFKEVDLVFLVTVFSVETR